MRPISFQTEYLGSENPIKIVGTDVQWLAAHFGYISYQIEYRKSGATWKSDPADYLYTNRVTLSEFPMAKTGYHLASVWTNEAGKVFLPGATVTGKDLGLQDVHVNGTNVILNVDEFPNVHGLSYELVSGRWPESYEPPSSANFDVVFSLAAPTRTGYDFRGWKVTANLDASTAKWGTTQNASTPVTADTLCVNGRDLVYFKNLNPTNGIGVTVTAQWSPSTIRVTFNNMGASSGKENLDVTYDASYVAVNTPTKTASAFLCYTIGGETYWNKDGQPTKSVWDIPTNCTAIAQWDEIPYAIIYDENRTDGRTSKTEVVPFTYGESITLSDGTFEEGTVRFENFGCTLLGWSINKQASTPDDGCGLGAVKTFYESKTLYAVWEKNYFIAYDGNGATEGEMEVQKLVVDKSGQVLNANAYTKTGYGFLGWATNRAAAAVGDWQYADHAVLPQTFAAVLGQTNVLFATWSTNTYYLAFDPNGGTGAPMPVMPCVYDQFVVLPACSYANGAYDFAGWSNDVAKVIYTDLSVPVSNLCATANGTNTLLAVWKLSELSAAMKCDNLRWESYAYKTDYTTYVNSWETESTGEGVWQTGDSVKCQQWLVAQVPTNGTLSFTWKPVGCEGQRYSLSYWITEDKDSYFKGIVDLNGADDTWQTCTISNVPSSYYVHFYVGSTDARSYCQIDNMTWTPDSAYPVPEAKDAAVISSAAVVDGRFVLSFAATNVFDYVLRTNADLRVDSWGEMEKTNGAATVTFEPPILPGLPQLFYKVETVQKK